VFVIEHLPSAIIYFIVFKSELFIENQEVNHFFQFSLVPKSAYAKEQTYNEFYFIIPNF